ncbi:MAG: hypothetical protein IKD55_14095 [Sediminibacterium sp.]|nr:hypothetical protein [Lactococcus carnosus]MBR2649975.1 hypothetical protein [Sediminibacterium sp.]MCJ1999826.1 hypothetical protein [Lactococcus carnosus]
MRRTVLYISNLSVPNLYSLKKKIVIVWWLILFVPFIFVEVTDSDIWRLICWLLLLCFFLFGMVAKVMIVFSQQLILYYHIDFEKWLLFEHYRYHKKKSAKYLVSLQVSEAKVAYYKGEFRESIGYVQDINEKALSRFIFSYQCSVKEVLCKSAIMLGDKAQSEAILSQLTLELDQNNSQTKKNKLKNILALGHSLENIVLDKVPNDDIISWETSTNYKLERLEKSYYQALNEQLKGNTDKAKADSEAISKESSDLFFVRESKQYLEDHK